MNFSILADINWIAVVVAVIGYYSVGAIWFSKAFFGVKWTKMRGVSIGSEDAKSKMSTMMVVYFVFMIVSCLVMALLIQWFDPSFFRSALLVGTLSGLGIAGLAIALSLIYQKKPAVVYLIEGGYHLMGSIVAAVILFLWR